MCWSAGGSEERLPLPRHPGAGVWFRKIGQEVEWCFVIEAFEPGSIVGVDEVVNEVVSLVMAVEPVLSGVSFGGRCILDGFGDPPIEALDHAVGLRMERLDEAVLDLSGGTKAIEGMVPGGFVLGFVLHVDGEAVGELRAIVGKDGVNRVREGIEEPLETSSDGGRITSEDNLDVDEAGGSIDGDEGVALGSLQGRQMLQIDMDEADAGGLEDTDLGLVGLRHLVEPVAHEAAMDGAARDRSPDTAAHHLGDVVEHQQRLAAQLADQPLLHQGQPGRAALRGVRAVHDRRAAAPPADGRLAHPQFRSQISNRQPALLDVGPDLRRRRCIGVQRQFHDPMRSMRYETPRSTPIPSNQSSGTKHAGGEVDSHSKCNSWSMKASFGVR